MIRQLISAIAPKMQVYLSRFLLLLAVGLGCFAVAATFRGLRLENRVTVAEGKLRQVEAANKTLDSALRTMQALRDADGAVLSALGNDIANINTRDRHVNRRISELEKNNEAVREYLNTRGPDGMLCMLDDTCDTNKDGISRAKQGSSPTVRSSGGPAQRGQPRRNGK